MTLSPGQAINKTPNRVTAESGFMRPLGEAPNG